MGSQTLGSQQAHQKLISSCKLPSLQNPHHAEGGNSRKDEEEDPLDPNLDNCISRLIVTQQYK
jgi:hypothetical protein